MKNNYQLGDRVYHVDFPTLVGIIVAIRPDKAFVVYPGAKYYGGDSYPLVTLRHAPQASEEKTNEDN